MDSLSLINISSYATRKKIMSYSDLHLKTFLDLDDTREIDKEMNSLLLYLVNVQNSKRTMGVTISLYLPIILATHIMICPPEIINYIKLVFIDYLNNYHDYLLKNWYPDRKSTRLN